MNFKKILMFPLLTTVLFTACHRSNYDPLKTIKYVSKQLDSEYEELPREGYYAVGKRFYDRDFQDLEGRFERYLPKGFSMACDWYESVSRIGETTWNVIYANKLTDLEGEIYYSHQLSGDCVQLWVVTEPLGSAKLKPIRTTFEHFQEEAYKVTEKDPGYKKCIVKGSATAMGFYFKLDHEFVKTEDGWELAKWGSGPTATLAANIMEYDAADFAESEEANATYYCGNGFIVDQKTSDGVNTMIFDAFGYITSLYSETGGNVDIIINWY